MMTPARFFLWSVAIVALLISAVLVWSRLPADSVPPVVNDAPLAANQAYCCTSAGTCAPMEKNECSTFFMTDRESCEARCLSIR